MARTRVFLVREVALFGSLSARWKDYTTWVDSIRKLLSRSAKVKTVSVEGDAVDDIINNGPGMRKSVVVFFWGGSAYLRAVALKGRYPHLQVVLVTVEPHVPMDDHSGILVINMTKVPCDTAQEAMLV